MWQNFANRVDQGSKKLNIFLRTDYTGTGRSLVNLPFFPVGARKESRDLMLHHPLFWFKPKLQNHAG